MTSVKKVLLSTFSLLFVLTLQTSTSNVAAEAKASKAPKKVKVQENGGAADSEIQAQMNVLASAAIAGDAEKMSSVFTEDATYIDESGDSTTGRSEIKQRFQKALLAHKPTSLKFDSRSLRYISSDVAVSDGVVRRADSEADGLPASTRYMLVFKKSDAGWQIANATETGIEAPPAKERMQELSWLIGDWEASRDGTVVHMSSHWIADGHFIQCRFEISKPNTPTIVEVQVVGWDPTAQRPISFTFNSNGGFGRGQWFKRDEKWFIEFNEVEQTGSNTRAVNVLNSQGNDSFTWQSTERSIDGVPAPDSDLVTVKRTQKKASL